MNNFKINKEATEKIKLDNEVWWTCFTFNVYGYEFVEGIPHEDNSTPEEKAKKTLINCIYEVSERLKNFKENEIHSEVSTLAHMRIVDKAYEIEVSLDEYNVKDIRESVLHGDDVIIDEAHTITHKILKSFIQEYCDNIGENPYIKKTVPKTEDDVHYHLEDSLLLFLDEEYKQQFIDFIKSKVKDLIGKSCYEYYPKEKRKME